MQTKHCYIFLIFSIIPLISCAPSDSSSNGLKDVQSGSVTNSGSDTTDVCITNCNGGNSQPNNDDGVESDNEKQDIAGDDPGMVIGTSDEEFMPPENCVDLCKQANGFDQMNAQCQAALEDECEENACTTMKMNSIPNALPSFKMANKFEKNGIEVDYKSEEISIEFCNGAFTALHFSNGQAIFGHINVGTLPVIDTTDVFDDQTGEQIDCTAQFIDHLPSQGVPMAPDVGRAGSCPAELKNTALVTHKGKEYAWSMPAILPYNLLDLVGQEKVASEAPIYVVVDVMDGPGLKRLSYHNNKPNTDADDPASGHRIDAVTEFFWWVDPVNTVTLRLFYAPNVPNP